MRHDPYQSPWRWVSLGSLLVFLIVIIAVGIASTTHSEPSSSSSSSITTRDPSNASPTTEWADNDKFTEVMYKFVEAYNLPTSSRRNVILRSLSTAEGYEMVMRDPQNLSSAEKAATGITVEVVSESTSVQVEPFDDDPNSISAYVQATVRIVRGGQTLRTVRLPGQTTSWIKQSGQWKFAHLET